MKAHNRNHIFRLVIAILLPFVAFALQSAFWAFIKPFAWFLFFPTVFFSSWIAGLCGGIIATAISTSIAWWAFIPIEKSFALADPFALGSIALFMIMGILFGYSHERIKKAEKNAADSLESERSANQQLQDANGRITQLYQKTLELDQLKTQLFANVSHELRTPLALILGPITKRLADNNLSAYERQELKVVERNARLLYRHVTDLLDVAKLEAGRMQIRYSSVDLASLSRVTASHFEVLAGEKHINYTVDVPDVIPAQLDAEKCERILINLLSNAFKFTPDYGSVSLNLSVSGDFAFIRVRDNGPGIPTSMKEIIFERFRQVEGGAERRFGGTGLGLAIAREFACLHEGAIDLADAPDGGAIFTVSLPLTAPEGTEIQAISSAIDKEIDHQIVDELHVRKNKSGQQRDSLPDAPVVLIVEDNPDMNEFLAGILGEHYRVITAFDGQDGLRKALGLRPDLILSDVMMPVMTGDQMVSELRTHSDMKDIPVVMLTAKADDELRVKMLKDGVQDYICKPFSVEELLARVGGLITERRRFWEELQRSEMLLRSIIDSANSIVWVKDLEGCFIIVNSYLEKLLGLPEHEILGRTVYDLFPKEIADEYARNDMDVITSGKIHEFEEMAELEDGQHSFFSVKTPLKDTKGAVFALSAICTDITKIKNAESEIRILNTELEQKVLQRTAELNSANQELESFAYAVSHDLRAPLRAMSGFSNALLEDYGRSLDDNAHVFLDQIIIASRKMGELIDGLLTLSRSIRGELKKDRIDISAMAKRIMTELSGLEPDRVVKWEIESGLSACGDIRMIESVMRNLLSNAWKYTSKTAEPAISILSKIKENRKFFCVADNGAGFDMNNAGKLFQPFQRLHRQDEFVGIGIGLATVQRIIHRHGGEIQAEASPNKGAAFSFFLPGNTDKRGGRS